ncbi:hypothetical protein ANME2D_01259 [Candidatus Methanoperedens nitroreducens]|uniref:Uncharacterized protein n=2 Tax=Candidatus Methanoperedens nitratireducens TaxID=1392998 RepID=A0A062VAR4_9EURY|nr:hypothetical protein ANME2D_01259 [Candidatus Methanoperedens nitroreducens]
MPIADEFIKYCTQILEVNFGEYSNKIINKVKSKKNLNDASSIRDFKEFICLIGLYTSVLAGKNKAVDICDALRAKATEITGEQKPPEVSIISEMDREINTFLMKKTLSTEDDTTDYAKYLALKYGDNTKEVEKDLIRKIKIYIKNAININRIKEAINRFLTNYPQPAQNDIDDFIHYIRLLKLKFREDELLQQIKKERLFRKFQEPRNSEEKPEINQLLDLIKTHNDKKDIIKSIQKQEISHIINHEPGLSDILLSEDLEDHKLNNPIALCDEKLMVLIDNKGGIVRGNGSSETKEIYNELPKREDDRSFEPKIKDALDYFFETKGIPAESDIDDIVDYLILCGHKQDKKQLIETFKQLSKEKIISALNYCVINNEIKYFIRRSTSYTQLDIENFIYYMKAKKLDINDDDVKDMIERERLFNRFNEMDREKSKEEKISRQYIALSNSGKKNYYEYILMLDEELIQLKLQLKLAKVLKKNQKHGKIGKKHLKKTDNQDVDQNSVILKLQ